MIGIPSFLHDILFPTRAAIVSGYNICSCNAPEQLKILVNNTSTKGWHCNWPLQAVADRNIICTATQTDFCRKNVTVIMGSHLNQKMGYRQNQCIQHFETGRKRFSAQRKFFCSVWHWWEWRMTLWTKIEPHHKQALCPANKNIAQSNPIRSRASSWTVRWIVMIFVSPLMFNNSFLTLSWKLEVLHTAQTYHTF